MINPPARRFVRLQYPSFPLGLGYIAATLIKHGHTVEIYDAEWNTCIEEEWEDTPHPFYFMASNWHKYRLALKNPTHKIWQEVEAVIRERNPEVIGITSRVLDLLSALVLAQIIKSINKEIVVVLGGPGATTCTDLALADAHVDFVVRQEGELTMAELVGALAERRTDYHTIDGLSFKESGKIIHNRPRPLIENIDSLSFPKRDLLLYAQKLPPFFYSTIMGEMITSRGCPYSCTFCANYCIWDSRKPRLRTAKDCLEEVLYLKEAYGIKDFVFVDDLFTLGRKRTIDICNLILEKKANISWTCLARADTIDDELLKVMKKAGCREVQLGVESGSERILKKMNKGLTLSEIRKAVKIVKKSKIPLRIFLLIGIPTETRSEMEATTNLIAELRPNFVELSVVTPYPGSPLFEELKREGLLNLRDWMFSDFLNVDSSYIGTMSNKEFRDLALRCLKECDEYNNRMNKPRTRYLYYMRHPILLAKKVREKLSKQRATVL